jgi:hypothetical protein
MALLTFRARAKSPHRITRCGDARSPRPPRPSEHATDVGIAGDICGRSKSTRSAMTNRQARSGGQAEPDGYEVRLQGHLDARWAAWFDGLSLKRENDGTTVIRGPIADQAALHGLLRKVNDLGLPLISVTRIQPPTEGNSSSETYPGIRTDQPRRSPR